MYLCALIQPAPMSRPDLRSESRDAILRVRFTRHKRFADRAFSVNGPKLTAYQTKLDPLAPKENLKGT